MSLNALIRILVIILSINFTYGNQFSFASEGGSGLSFSTRHLASENINSSPSCQFLFTSYGDLTYLFNIINESTGKSFIGDSKLTLSHLTTNGQSEHILSYLKNINFDSIKKSQVNHLVDLIVEPIGENDFQAIQSNPQAREKYLEYELKKSIIYKGLLNYFKDNSSLRKSNLLNTFLSGFRKSIPHLGNFISYLTVIGFVTELYYSGFTTALFTTGGFITPIIFKAKIEKIVKKYESRIFSEGLSSVIKDIEKDFNTSLKAQAFNRLIHRLTSKIYLVTFVIAMFYGLALYNGPTEQYCKDAYNRQVEHIVLTATSWINNQSVKSALVDETLKLQIEVQNFSNGQKMSDDEIISELNEMSEGELLNYQKVLKANLELKKNK